MWMCKQKTTDKEDLEQGRGQAKSTNQFFSHCNTKLVTICTNRISDFQHYIAPLVYYQVHANAIVWPVDAN